MSDYMFMLESHLSAEQFRVIGLMRQLAGESGINLFLTGGAMRFAYRGLRRLRQFKGAEQRRPLEFALELAARSSRRAAR